MRMFKQICLLRKQKKDRISIVQMDLMYGEG